MDELPYAENINLMKHCEVRGKAFPVALGSKHTYRFSFNWIVTKYYIKVPMVCVSRVRLFVFGCVRARVYMHVDVRLHLRMLYERVPVPAVVHSLQILHQSAHGACVCVRAYAYSPLAIACAWAPRSALSLVI